MRQFESPEINISYFFVEKILTVSGADEKTQAAVAAKSYLTDNVEETVNLFDFTF